jgi:uncharacterized OsmC-like protein
MKLATIQKINGVDTARLQETVSNVKASPELGRFKFQIANRWIGAGETRTEVKSFYGCRQDNSHKTVFHLAADEPDILLGRDNGANPVEHLLHALVSCVTTSMVYHAAARGIAIEQVESTLDGDLDLRGFLGLDPTVRNGYQQIRLKLRIKSTSSASSGSTFAS